MNNRRVSIAKKVGTTYPVCVGRTGTIVKEYEFDYDVLIDGETVIRRLLESHLYFPHLNTYNQQCFKD